MTEFQKRTFDIFRQLNAIPRPSHHEERVADFLCDYARGLELEYERDAQNCVVIRKPASPGCEGAETIVLLNHMDMVAVGDGSRPFDPLHDGVEAYIEDGWMKARGTSLGADNGIGLSMALAVLACEDLVHGPLEVLTTTNEEDGMSGAASMSPDFIKGRRVINLDSEDYDTITVGAAGAYLQKATFAFCPAPSIASAASPAEQAASPAEQAASPAEQVASSTPIQEAPPAMAATPAPGGAVFFEISISGGLGGHSGVDIGKGRANAIRLLAELLCACAGELSVASIDGGSANASIPSSCRAVIGVSPEEAEGFEARLRAEFSVMRERFSDGAGLKLEVRAAGGGTEVRTAGDGTEGRTAGDDAGHFPVLAGRGLLQLITSLPCGVIRMHETLPGTVMTSNNIGVISTVDGSIGISCHTRSFSDEEMVGAAEGISKLFRDAGAGVEVLMNTPGWQENPDSGFLALTDATFRDVLGFLPRKVAMHFVLEAGYYVQKFPGIQIACIGPRIVEPHSTSERVELQTVRDICAVLIELLARLAAAGPGAGREDQ